MNNSTNIREDRSNASESSNEGPRSEPIGSNNSKSLLRRIRNYKRVRLKAAPVRPQK